MHLSPAYFLTTELFCSLLILHVYFRRINGVRQSHLAGEDGVGFSPARLGSSLLLGLFCEESAGADEGRLGVILVGVAHDEGKSSRVPHSRLE